MLLQPYTQESIMSRFKVAICSATAGLLLVTSFASATDNDWRYAGNSLQGAWLVDMTVRLPADDCTTAPLLPPPAPNPFPAFNTFHEGGTMSEWGSRVSPSRRSSGHGVWERVGNQRYAYRLMFHSFDEFGALTATMDWHMTLKLSKDGDSFEGVGRFTRTSVDETAPVLNFCGTMTARRISL
jgi:hypothetical protein